MIVTAVGMAPERSFSARSSADLTSNRPEICPRSLIASSLMTGAEIDDLALGASQDDRHLLAKVLARGRLKPSCRPRGTSTKSTTLRCIESAPRRAERQVVAHDRRDRLEGPPETPVFVPLDST